MDILKLKVVEEIFKIIYLLICFSLIQACSDSQFEKRLADSFDSPLKPVNSTKKSENINTVSLPSSKELRESNVKKPLKIKSKKQLKPSFKRTNKFIPQPYRIILRLSEANPSAPAEKVTSVLRDAGVVFEIEKIERLDEKALFNDSSNR